MGTLLNRHPRVVVIGGGLTGCSVALHLVERGVSEVTLLERGAIGQGATGQSLGFMGIHIDAPWEHALRRGAAEIYKRAAAETGSPIDRRPLGQIVYTTNHERWRSWSKVPERSRAVGVTIDALTPAETAIRMPLIDVADLVGGLWLPEDGMVDTAQAVTGLIRMARARGATIRENLPVTAIRGGNGIVDAVVTPEGEIRCDAVVVAAGAWSAEVTQLCALSLPLQSIKRSVLITTACGVWADTPLFTSYDDGLFGRTCAGGLILGRFDAELDHDLGALRRRFPSLGGADSHAPLPLRPPLSTFHGYTPDGRPLLGPVPGITGLYTACGCDSDGASLVVGRLLAEWIATGAPGADISAIDVRRFSAAQSADTYLRERVTEIPALPCRISAMGEDFRTARNLFSSPLRERLAEAGAHFATVTAWERAAWLRHGAGDAFWAHAVAHEVRAAITGVLAVDRSADCKILLSGPGAAAWFDARAPAGLDADARAGGMGPHQVQSRLLPSAAGRVDALVRVFMRGADWCLIATTPDQETHLNEWLRCARVPDTIQLHHETLAYAHLELYGPRRAALLRKLSNSSIGARFQVRHDTFNDTTLLSVPTPSATVVWRRLLTAGRDFDLSLGGHLAEEALRISRGIPAFGREISCATTIDELTAMAWPHRDAEPGSDARPRPPRTFGAFSSPLAAEEFGGGERILAGNRCIGSLTSRLRLPGWPSMLALGWLDFSLWHGEKLELIDGGQRWPLEPRESPWEIAQRTRHHHEDGAQAEEYKGPAE